MRVDHVVYAAGSDGLMSTAERLGALVGVEPSDGGVHPRFGTRNCIIPLENGRFIEVVEVLDHPASFKAPFGQAVRACSEAGGGWLGWVVRVDDIGRAEGLLGREAAPGNRHRPDGVELTWKQIGVKGLMSDAQLPFFIEWADGTPHPSDDGPTHASLTSLQIGGSPVRVREWLGLDGSVPPSADEFEPGISFDFSAPHGTPGILTVSFDTEAGPVTV